MIADICMKNVEGRMKDEIMGHLDCEANCPSSCRRDIECGNCCNCLIVGSSPLCSDNKCSCTIFPPVSKNIPN